MDINYYPEVVQVIPTKNFEVYIYFDDGSIKLYNAKELINKGVFRKLREKNTFMEACTVLNGTLAWDLERTYDVGKCLDLDPLVLYENCPEVKESEEFFKS